MATIFLRTLRKRWKVCSTSSQSKVQGESSAERWGNMGLLLHPSRPSPPLQLRVLPSGSPCWLISREKRAAAGARSEDLSSDAAVPCEQWKSRAGRGTGSSDCIARVPPETCHFLRLPTDHHSHILHSSVTSFSSLSSSTISHCQILSFSSSVSSGYPLYYSLMPTPSSPMSFPCTACDSR